NNKTLVTMLRGGRQTPLKATIHNVRTIEQMAGRIAEKLEFDSVEFMQFIEQRFDSIAGTKPETRLTRFIPNTYEFYWTVSPEEFSSRMLKEHERFWTNEKKAKAEQLGLSTEEVYTLASIIEKETNHNPEKPRMAGVYLNRIRDGIPLQADPTIVFALGDFELRRVLYGHLGIESPYNTYRNLGLPPGPIFMPGLPSINAVLDREVHDYLYFCAKPSEDGPGHAFASSLPEHNQNAQRYQRWLDSQGY
ncbi:MAG: endolytic transglycosylase MltG, partial [Saprospiraceae bacterium]